VPSITTIAGAIVAVMGIEALQSGEIEVKPLQDYHKAIIHDSKLVKPAGASEA